MKNRNRLSVFFLTVILFLVSACSLPQLATEKLRRPVMDAGTTIVPTNESTPLPAGTGDSALADFFTFLSHPMIIAANIDHLTELKRFSVPGFTTSEITFSPDGELLAVASSEGIHFYSTDDFVETRILDKGNQVINIAFSPDGEWIASITNNFTAKVFKVSDGSVLFGPGKTGAGYDVAFEEGTNLLAFDRGGCVKFWDITKNEEVKWFPAGGGAVLSIAFSPDGKKVAAAAERIFQDSPNGSVVIWDLAQDELLHKISENGNSFSDIEFSPDSQFLATAGRWNGEVRIWSVSDGSLVADFVANGLVKSIAFSPDGRLLFAGSSTSVGVASISIWDTLTGELLRTLNTETNTISLAISPDGRLLASVSLTGEVHIWGIAPLNQCDPSG